jgi:hypothetical protein
MKMLLKPADTKLKESLGAFKIDLRTERSEEYIVDKWIIDGPCELFDPDSYLILRRSVASKFGIHPNDVLVVGSAKLGFSISPEKRFRLFHEKSDIDVAVVSSSLFDEVWTQVLDLKHRGVEWEKAHQFQEYLFDGWIRPDFMPRNYPGLARGWWDFFRKLTQSTDYDRKVAGGLYKSWHHLELYHQRAISGCRQELEG